MQIPNHGFGFKTPDPQRIGRSVDLGGDRVGAAISRGGATMQRIGERMADEKIEERNAEWRIKAGKAIAERELAVATLDSDLEMKLRSGEVAHDQVEKARADALSKLKDDDFKGAPDAIRAHVENAYMQIGGRGQIRIKESAQKARIGSMQTDIKLLLEAQGKKAGLPGANVDRINAGIDAMDADGRLAFGDDWPLVKNKFRETNYINSVEQRINEAGDDYGALKQLEKDLKGGYYADKLDAAKRISLQESIGKRIEIVEADNYADAQIAKGVSYEDALASARSKFSGDDEDRRISRIKERYGELASQKREREREMVDALNRKLYETGDITQVTDDEIQAFADNGNYTRAMELRENRKRALDVKASGGEYARESVVETRQQLDRLIMDGEITDARQLVQYKGGLDKGDYSAAEKLIEKRGLLDQSGAVQAYRELLPADKQKKNYVETEEDRIREAQFLKDAADFVRETHRPQDLKAFAADWMLAGKAGGRKVDLPVIGEITVGDKEMTQGEAVAAGLPFAPEKPLPRNVITQDYLDRRQQKTVVRTGMLNGRKVVQYSDGSTEYAQ